MVRSTTQPIILTFVIAIFLVTTASCIGAEKNHVTVPEDAQAGELFLEPCTYKAKRGTYPADCGTLIVPENRNNPDSNLIALSLIRVKATGADPSHPIFFFIGGPGQSNLNFQYLDGLIDKHDFVQVGYRGIDGSSVLDCPETVSALKSADDLLSEPAVDSFYASMATCAARVQSEGVDITGYTLLERISDMEAARTALGYDRVNLLSSSAGTRTTTIYAQTHPSSIFRSVMIAVNPPGHFLWKADVLDEQLTYYAALCGQDPDCGGRTDNLAETMREVAERMPERWLFLPIKPGNVKLATFFSMMHTSTDPLSAPMAIDAWLSAAEGDPSGLAFLSLLADLLLPSAFIWGEASMTAGLDRSTALDYLNETNLNNSIMGTPGSSWLFGGTSGWPLHTASEAYNRVEPSAVETLLIGGTVDLSTPPQFARDELLPSLSNGQQIILSEFGHTDDIWRLQPEATAHLITTYYATGVVDDSLFTHQSIDFDVERSLSMMAKLALTLIVITPLVLLFIVWLIVRRVRLRQEAQTRSPNR